MRLARVTLIWAALAAAIGVPIAAAAVSPLLEWRGPVYILAGFAGIVALGLMLVQPLLIGGYLPGLPARIGTARTSLDRRHAGRSDGDPRRRPLDHQSARHDRRASFASPTPFSPFGVIAMWAIFAVALLAALRRRLECGRERGASLICRLRWSSSPGAWSMPC